MNETHDIPTSIHHAAPSQVTISVKIRGAMWDPKERSVMIKAVGLNMDVSSGMIDLSEPTAARMAIADMILDQYTRFRRSFEAGEVALERDHFARCLEEANRALDNARIPRWKRAWKVLRGVE